MPKIPTPFVEHVLEMMREVETVRARSMFGGWGLYSDGKMFALIADDVLYFKTDDFNRADFEAENLELFVYQSNEKRATMNYSRAPDEVFEDSEAMTHWAQTALAAAQRQAQRKSQQQSQHPTRRKTSSRKAT